MGFDQDCQLAKFERPKAGETLLMQRAYDAVREHGTMNRRRLAGVLGISSNSASQVLRKLRRIGVLIAKPTAQTWHVEYSLAPGAKRPKDGRGKSPGSREALRLEWRPTPASMANLITHGIPKPRPRTALEKAWGWGTGLAIISTVDDEET